MSFNITLQRNNSETNRVTKNITDLATITGDLKQETSIIDPVILIEGDLSSYTGCNYCTIQTFGRSYFINNIRSIRNSLFEISCHVDVLSSFATQIKACTGIVQRQENEWNLYLNDGVFKVYQNPIVQVKEFPADFDHPSFVLALVGN